VIASSEGPSAHDDDEVIRGLRVWSGRLDQGGISYTPRRIVEVHGRFGGHLSATVQLEVVRTGAQPAEAALAAQRLVRGGANVLVGPTSPAALAAVSQFAARRRVLMLSITRPPVSAGRPRTNTWLSIPSADQLDGTLALVRERADARKAPARMAILSAGGPWAARAHGAVTGAERRLVQARAYDASRLGARRALAAAARSRPAAIVTLAPLRQARAWFRAARGMDASVPWVLTAGDAAAAARELRSERVAVEVPWSPETPRTGRIFTDGHDFSAAYARAYGGLPPTKAVAGAALGLTLDAMVAFGRSTDPTRMLLVREQMNALSIWGALEFDHGQERTPTSQLVLVDHGRIRQIAPPPPSSTATAPFLLLRSSVPPAR
jgi:ABC-type branched-subunit amino acid transport system substrate-binding protein